MGADQSKGNTQSTTDTPQFVKKCYYEILQTEQSSETDTIKKQYRKLALQWHPDRNIDNTEYATEQFKLIQEAYDILSDANERAWYDTHRTSILTGKNVNNATDSSHDTATSDFESKHTGYYDIDIYQFFSTQCYNNKFDDSSKSFYTVYKQVFDTIASLETDTDLLPSFGDQYSEYSTVHKFYTYYTNFVTTRTFEWKCKWKLSDAPTRLHKRAMQTENQQAIKQAKKEYNDTVRQLALFCKKRDPRVLKQQVLDAENERKRHAAELHAKQQAEQQRAALREQYKHIEQQRYQQQEQQRQQAYSWSVKEEQQRTAIEQQLHDTANEYVCQICNKVFKSEGQLKNHEASKKHNDMVKALQRKLGTDIIFDDTHTNDKQPYECVVCDLTFTTEKKLYLHQQSITHERRVEANKAQMQADEIVRQQAELDALKLNDTESKTDKTTNNDTISPNKVRLTKKQRRALQKQRQAAVHNDSSSDSSDDDTPDSKTTNNTTKTNGAQKHTTRESSSDRSSSDSSDNDEPPVKHKRTQSSSSSDSDTSTSDSGTDSDNDIKQPTTTDIKPKLTAKQKKQLRADKKLGKQKGSSTLKCSVCNEAFTSRTKLFAHIKEQNHAALKR